MNEILVQRKNKFKAGFTDFFGKPSSSISFTCCFPFFFAFGKGYFGVSTFQALLVGRFFLLPPFPSCDSVESFREVFILDFRGVCLRVSA